MNFTCSPQFDYYSSQASKFQFFLIWVQTNIGQDNFSKKKNILIAKFNFFDKNNFTLFEIYASSFLKKAINL